MYQREIILPSCHAIFPPCFNQDNQTSSGCIHINCVFAQNDFAYTPFLNLYTAWEFSHSIPLPDPHTSPQTPISTNSTASTIIVFDFPVRAQGKYAR